MKEAGLLSLGAILLGWLTWNLWNLLRLVTGLRDGSWRRPVWWTRLLSVSLFTGFAIWLRGALSGALDIRETCLVHRQTYDEVYWDSHAAEFQKIFPLHNKCNAHYDLVPAWVNPALVTCAVLSLAASAALLWFGVVYLAGVIRKASTS